jgi:hypothetical protein
VITEIFILLCVFVYYELCVICDPFDTLMYAGADLIELPSAGNLFAIIFIIFSYIL